MNEDSKTQSILGETFRTANIDNIGNIGENTLTPSIGEVVKEDKDSIKSAGMQMTPKTPMTTLKRIGDSPAVNTSNLTKREAFKEKLAPIPINVVCTVLHNIYTDLILVSMIVHERFTT